MGMGDRQKLIDFLMDNITEDNPWMGRVKELVDKLEAEGFAFVVLCKDCKHRGDDTYCPMCYEEEYEIDEGDGYSCSDYITHDRTIDDGFCDRGERRTDNDSN